MIDLVVNDRGQIFVMHDERDLDTTKAIVIESDSKKVNLDGEFGSRFIGVLKQSMFDAMKVNGKIPEVATVIRTSSFSLAKIHAIQCRVS